MPRPDVPLRSLRTVVLATAVACAPALAFAQGTAEQQEACAPDAVKLCSATIPDIPKTTACMKAHVADLSPRCRSAFFAATGGAAPKAKVAAGEERHAAPPTRRQTRRVTASRAAPPAAERVAPAVAAAPPPVPRAAIASGAGLPGGGALGGDLLGVAGARAQIVRSCRQGLIDPFTCRNTAQLFGLGE